MKFLNRYFILLLLVTVSFSVAAQKKYLFQDAKLSTDKRVDDLINQNTIGGTKHYMALQDQAEPPYFRRRLEWRQHSTTR